MFDALLPHIPRIIEGGFLSVMVELLVSHHSRKLEKEMSVERKLIDERFDRVEQDLVRLEEGRKWEFQTLTHQIKSLDDAKLTRPPRD